MAVREDLELLQGALASEGEAYRLILSGHADAAAAPLEVARRAYLASWDAAPPGSYGRLVGAVKAAILLGDDAHTARRVREAVGEARGSPTAAYALALAALHQGDDEAAGVAAAAMDAGGPAFARTGAAIRALADGDAEGYRAAVAAIVDDFAGRDDHVTGVPIADTALVLERLAAPRRLAARPASPLLPPA
jgi:hypothetical protein